MPTIDNRYDIELGLLGEKVKKLRIALGLSQLLLAEKIGVERSEISKIENGKQNVQFRTLIRLADALAVETYELLAPDLSLTSLKLEV